MQVCMHNEQCMEEFFCLLVGFCTEGNGREDNIAPNLICTPCVLPTLHALHTVTIILAFLQHVISMPRMLCVVVCVLCYLLSYSPALTSKSSHLTTVVLLSTCQRRKLILRQINTLFSLHPTFCIHSSKQPSFQ